MNTKEIGTKLGVVLLLLAGITGIAGATTFNTVSIQGQILIPSNCVFSANVATINFGTLQQGTSTNVNFAILLTNGGNIASNVFVSGADWTDGATHTFLAGNTLWNVATQASYTGTALTGSAVDTMRYVPSAGATNTLFWGSKAPLYQYPASYTQAISVSNSC